MTGTLPLASGAAAALRQPTRQPHVGRAHWQVRQSDGVSSVVGAQASSPLSLLVPQPRGRACWGFLASHGGGLVSGDALHIVAEVGPSAAGYLGTQGLGKVYRGLGDEACTQDVQLVVGAGALLVWAPDPLAGFAGARYRQRLDLTLAPGASAVLVDGLHAGRVARGEVWQAERLDTRLHVTAAGRLALFDRLLLERATVRARLQRWACLATVLLAGPRAAPAIAALAEVVPTPVRGGALLASVAPCAVGVLVRIAARTSAALQHLIAAILDPLAQALGGAPWHRRP